ncbi:MAG: copper resistance protein NlpE, partial [Chitinophagaceae bacterium]
MKKINYKSLKVICFFCFIAMIGLAACSPKIKADETLSKGDNSMVSLDWNGTYMGKIPCADCQGIETTMILSKDGSYILKTKYLGKSDAVNEKSGKFTWNSAGSTITLDGIYNAPNQYIVGENVLIQLD